MFFFTTSESPSPASSVRRNEPGIPAKIKTAIERAAERSQVDFGYLARTAAQESNFNPQAQAKTSSARGLFQVLEQTWLGLVKRDGPQIGLKQQAEAITQRSDGSYTVEDAAQRRAILDLRLEPETAATLTGFLTRRNHDLLAAELGREPQAGELYAAHFLGARGAAELIRLVQHSPSHPADSAFPQAAAANRAVFSPSGQSRSVVELYQFLTSGHAGNMAAVTGMTGSNPERTPTVPLAQPLAQTLAQTGGFHGLFQNGQRRETGNGALLRDVAALWGKRAASPGYFPRSEPIKGAITLSPNPVSSSSASSSPSTQSPSPVSAPLDLRRFVKPGVS
jgi:hypothetical protein